MKTTYFTGAGASFHSLPLIKTMNERMVLFNEYLKSLTPSLKIKKENLDFFTKEFDFLIEQCANSTSIDSYAKELSNAGKNLKLHHLKMLLSGYLIFEQLIKPNTFISELEELNSHETSGLSKSMKNHVDKRYRTFWSNHLVENSLDPKPHIKVISWNYDMQFELSYSLAKECSLELAQQNLQIYPSPIYQFSTKDFCIVKLNGTAGLYTDHPYKKLNNSFDLSKHHLDDFNIGIILNMFERNYRRAFSNPIFSFAWENDERATKAREYSKEILSKTELLVIIGYSFPNYNREVDRQIFSELKNLKRVYLQYPMEEIPMIKEKMKNINEDLITNVIPWNDLSEFPVPLEL